MNANVIYIHEDELSLDFTSELNQTVKSDEPLFVVLQMKAAKSDFQPLINNLIEIRKDKAKKKLEDWLAKYAFSSQTIVTYIRGNENRLKESDLDLSNMRAMNYFYHSKEGRDFMLLLIEHFAFESFKENLLGADRQ